MATPEKVEAVKKVSEAMGTQQASPMEELERVAPNREQFQTLFNSSDPLKTDFEIKDSSLTAEDVQNKEKNPVFAEENVSTQKSGKATDDEGRHRQQQTDEVEGVSGTSSKKKSSASLTENINALGKQASNLSELNPADLQKQTKEIISQIDQVKTQLAESSSEIKPSYQTLLRNRLTHIDDNLQIALSKLGVESPAIKKIDTSKMNPAERFISMLTNSQSQMETVQQELARAAEAKGTEYNPMKFLALQTKLYTIQEQVELFTSLLNKALESTKTIMNVQV
jgi:hypothetical protein